MDEDIRIKDLPLVEDGIQSTDYIAVDNEDDGTRKATIQDVMEANVSGLETTATNTKGAINELFNKASRTVSLTQAEYDALPSSKLSDDIAYFITDGEPDVDNALWTKVGRATLDTQAQNCSEAINEIKQSLSDYIKLKSVTVLKADLATNMNLSSYVSLDSGYKFLSWQVAGVSNGWITQMPIYISNPSDVRGFPWWHPNLTIGGAVNFYYFEIKDV